MAGAIQSGNEQSHLTTGGEVCRTPKRNCGMQIARLPTDSKNLVWARRDPRVTNFIVVFRSLSAVPISSGFAIKSQNALPAAGTKKSATSAASHCPQPVGNEIIFYLG